VEPAEAVPLAQHIAQRCKHLRLAGLMTIGQPDYSSRPENFVCLQQCRAAVAAALGLAEAQLELSMGMSGDFEQAVGGWPAAGLGWASHLGAERWEGRGGARWGGGRGRGELSAVQQSLGFGLRSTGAGGDGALGVLWRGPWRHAAGVAARTRTRSGGPRCAAGRQHLAAPLPTRRRPRPPPAPQVEMGSTNIRVGSTIFGAREYPAMQAAAPQPSSSS
jgi:hypothetical protein